MKTKITLSALLFLICTFTGFSQTTLFNFEDGVVPASFWWTGSSYSSLAAGTNPSIGGINTSAKSLNVTLKTGIGWGNTFIKFTLATPTTITASNRYLHIMYRTDNVSNGNSLTTLDLNATWDLGGSQVNKTRFDFTISTANQWRDLVVDLNGLGATQLSNFGITPNTLWATSTSVVNASFDEVVLNSNPAPRATTPTISTSATNIYSFSYIYGNGPSVEQTFTVGGVTLTNDIILTPTAPYEISTTTGTGFTSSSITLPQTGGSVAATTIYARMKAGMGAGTQDNKAVTIASTGATSQTTALWGWVNSKTITVSGISANDKVYDGTTTATLSGTAAYSGLVSGDVFSVTGTPSTSFADANVGTAKAVTVTGYTAPNANYVITQPTGLTASISQATQSIVFNTLTDVDLKTLPADFDPGATSTTSAVNPITYQSSDLTVATIVANKIHPVAKGVTTITASQAGSTNYSAASDVQKTLTVVDTSTGLAASTSTDLMYAISDNNGLHVVAQADIIVDIYNVNGSLVASKLLKSHQKETFSLNNAGIYCVLATDNSGKTQFTKVLVK